MVSHRRKQSKSRGAWGLSCAAVAALFVSPSNAAAAGSTCADVNRSGTATTSDALLILRRAVGQDVAIDCPAPATPLRTGQTTCSNAAGAPQTCAGSRQDADLQFGLDRRFTDNGDGTITDEVTGLVWEKLSNDGSIHDVDNQYTWDAAFTSKIATLSAANFGGHSDWRVPNLFELQTIVSLGAAGPATHPIFNSGCGVSCTIVTCSCTAPDYYWSSTTHHTVPGSAWQVLFDTGHEEWSSKPGTARVRAVTTAD